MSFVVLFLLSYELPDVSSVCVAQSVGRIRPLAIRWRCLRVSVTLFGSGRSSYIRRLHRSQGFYFQTANFRFEERAYETDVTRTATGSVSNEKKKKSVGIMCYFWFGWRRVLSRVAEDANEEVEKENNNTSVSGVDAAALQGTARLTLCVAPLGSAARRRIRRRHIDRPPPIATFGEMASGRGGWRLHPRSRWSGGGKFSSVRVPFVYYRGRVYTRFRENAERYYTRIENLV